MNTLAKMFEEQDRNEIFLREVPKKEQFNEKEWLRLAEKLWETKQEIKELKEMEEGLLESLKQESRHEAKSHGQWIFSVTERQSIDYKTAVMMNGIDIEPFRKEPTYSWSIKKKETRNKQLLVS